MSDVSKTNKLIVAKLRKAAKQAEWYQALDTKLLTAAANALEAATRVPVQGEPNDDRELLRIILTDTWSTEMRTQNIDAILAAGFSRATVSDAATEAIGRGRLHDAVNALPNHVWDAVNEIADTEGFTDALLAALDGAPEPEWEYGLTFEPYVTGDAASPSSYDGCETEGGARDAGRRLAGPAQTYQVWKRPMRPAVQPVPAGPWLPVEGEKP